MYLKAVKEQTLKYLNIDIDAIDAATEALLDECLLEIENKSTPRYISKVFPLTHNPLSIEDISLDYLELNALFSNCHSICIIGATLGINVDRICTILSKTNMSKLLVFDAVASSYLEVMCDEYEKTLGFKERTFRYCPGYGQTPLELNKILCRSLQMDKHIGLTVKPSLLLLPQKSMIGLIGLGGNTGKKTCDNCQKFTNCELRKKELRCYIQ